MSISRRQALLTTLFGAGATGLRALATGLPATFFVNPRNALAAPTCMAKPQYFILSTSGGGDPLNANCPGTYGDPNIVHSPDPAMAPTTFTLGGQSVVAAKPWSTLPTAALARTQFWHIMTDTPVHPKESQVLGLMGAAAQGEMLPSLLAKAVAPCLNTIQSQPVALGPEVLTYGGQTLPVIVPLALKDTLSNPSGPLTSLQSIRDQAMNQVYAVYRNGATPSQQAYIDQMVSSQQQARSIEQSLLGNLASITDNGPSSQMLAAITLIQMNVAPVISMHIPFGGDNHGDTGLVNETAQTVAGVGVIASMMTQLQSAIGKNGQSLFDQVTFMTLNVFGRTLKVGNGGVATNALQGRNHNQNHQVSVVIGKPFKAGILGGVMPVGADYGATGIDSATGAGGTGGDVQPEGTLGAFGQTMLAAVGGDTTQIQTGKVVAAALA